jgi:Cu+-exporting ATPase
MDFQGQRICFQFVTQLRLIEEIITKREVDSMAKDLVCGMSFDENEAGAKYDFEGHTYYFCADECKDKFAQAPEKFM